MSLSSDTVTSYMVFLDTSMGDCVCADGGGGGQRRGHIRGVGRVVRHPTPDVSSTYPPQQGEWQNQMDERVEQLQQQLQQQQERDRERDRAMEEMSRQMEEMRRLWERQHRHDL
ncbi:hypothetical protein E3N88_30347 [Mikania micrantha]|uniref:Uncharacterized protein n=1 Tax=Mikania micrantha TaxID=192012 RepID=A0A5N6MLT4_9ASTR|nr:hypothetical protein E3N88_30347 [Mikania micrantha]